MYRYKWCICDMDGTLLDSQKNISAENIAALMKLKQNRVEVILASGRLDLMVKSYIAQLDLKGYMISCNGGLIRDVETGEIIYSRVMDYNIAKKIIEYADKNQINYLIYTTDYVYSNRNNPRVRVYEDANRNLDRNFQIPIKYIDNTFIKDLKKIDLLKILMICDNKVEVKYLQSLFLEYEAIEAVSSAEGLLDIMAAGTSKGQALKFLARRQNVNLNDVIAIGDNYNDIEMLKCVGMPVAMENSVDKLKSVAKYITKSNEASGVAYAINQLIC